jgi:hypothetical protein
MLASHALAHPPHLQYVPWLSVVEVNTFLLIARRHANRAAAWVRAALDVGFYLSWFAIRVLWFPAVTVHVWCRAPPWPLGLHGLVSRLVVTTLVTLLTVLQCVWTDKMMRPLLRQLLTRGGEQQRSSGFL